MSYSMKTKYGKKITIEPYHGDVSLAIEGKADVLIHPEHAPALALAILLAAGIDMDHESVGLSMATRNLRDVVSINEATKRAEALNKRRDELARELAGDGAYAYLFATAFNQRAIDRIIELEQAP